MLGVHRHTSGGADGGERAAGGTAEGLALPCCCSGDSATGTARGVQAGPAGPVGSFCGVSGAGTAAGRPMGNGPLGPPGEPRTGCRLRGDSIYIDTTHGHGYSSSCPQACPQCPQ